MTTTNRNALLETPDVPWASDAIELVFTQESRSVANHSARSWIFARMLRDHLNLTQEVDETLLFAATLLHDIGLRRDARDPVRFEIDGADRAAEFLTAQGLDAAQVDGVGGHCASYLTRNSRTSRSADLPDPRGRRDGLRQVHRVHQ